MVTWRDADRAWVKRLLEAELTAVKERDGLSDARLARLIGDRCGKSYSHEGMRKAREGISMGTDLINDLITALGPLDTIAARHPDIPRPRADSLTLREPTVEYQRGSLALETVLARIEWPEPFDVAAADAAASQARSEAFSDGQDRPESIWTARVRQLYRENVGRAKTAPARPPVESTDKRDDDDRAAEKSRRRGAKPGRR